MAEVINESQRICTTPPVLLYPAFAGGLAVNSVLDQKRKNGLIRLIRLSSCLLKAAEKFSTTSEREALALVLAKKIFCVYFQFIGPFKLHADHQALTKAFWKKDPNMCIAH